MILGDLRDLGIVLARHAPRWVQARSPGSVSFSSRFHSLQDSNRINMSQSGTFLSRCTSDILRCRTNAFKHKGGSYNPKRRTSDCFLVDEFREKSIMPGLKTHGSPREVCKK